MTIFASLIDGMFTARTDLRCMAGDDAAAKANGRGSSRRSAFEPVDYRSARRCPRKSRRSATSTLPTNALGHGKRVAIGSAD